MAANIAPGLQRSFGFERWLQHDAAAWQQLKQEAEQKRQVGLAQVLPKFIGYDTSADAIALAQQAANQLGIESYLEFEQQDIAQLENVTHCNKGLLLTNPPYGNRLNAHEDLVPLYQTIAQHARENFMAWRLGIFTGSPDFCSKIGIRPYKKYRFLNGDLPCQLLLYEVIPEYFSSTSDFRLS
jgi:23S rRNA (guanine2445-N2)-methyltransferase / 23S rRNA (guanine2069-N7)-methyltransferase